MALDTNIIIPTNISSDVTQITSRRELDLAIRLIDGGPFTEIYMEQNINVLSYYTQYPLIISAAFGPYDDTTLEYTPEYFVQNVNNSVITIPTRNVTSRGGQAYIYTTNNNVNVEVEFVANQPSFDVYTYVGTYFETSLRPGTEKAFYGLVKNTASYDTLMVSDIELGYLLNGNTIQMIASGVVLDSTSAPITNDWIYLGIYEASVNNFMWDISDTRWTEGLCPACFFLLGGYGFLNTIYNTKNIKFMAGATNRAFDLIEFGINGFGFHSGQPTSARWQNFNRTAEVNR